MAGRDVLEVKKMLEALLRSEGLVEWIGGYVYGRTSNNDPFIILYPASDNLKEKTCRVYEHAFSKLPKFIPTDDVPGDTEDNPSKGQAQRAGIYHTCPPFKIAMYLGKDTNMGREKRFSDVLYIPPVQPAPAAGPAMKAEPPAPASGKQPASDVDEDDVKARWRVEAATSQDPFIFDTAILKLSPWYQDSTNVKEFRELLFGNWDPGRTGAYVVGLESYASQRERLNGSTPARKAHAAAKLQAMKAYQQALNS